MEWQNDQPPCWTLSRRERKASTCVRERLSDPKIHHTYLLMILMSYANIISGLNSISPHLQDFQTPVVNRCGNQPKSWHGTGNAGRYGGGNVSSSNRKDGSSVMTAGLVSGGSSRGGGLDHILFYSVCQATFYITCFRGLDIAAMDAITDHVSSIR